MGDRGEIVQYLDVVEENEFPSFKMSTDSNVHVLHGGPLQPPTSILQGLYPPNARRPIEPKEIDENAVHLLLYLKMEC